MRDVMFSGIRKHVTYANVAVTVALVFAMSGGAYAASKYLIVSAKQISPKVLKQLVGKRGPVGSAGVNGGPGPAGKEGAAGKEGPAGKEGVQGKEGKTGGPGESVSAKEVKAGETACAKQGGGEFKVGSTTTYACNGSPWTVGGLPSGASERGTWSISGQYHQGDYALASISFPVPLKESLGGAQVHFIEIGGTLPAGCEGSFEEPKALSGNLCVFESAEGAEVGFAGFDGFAVNNTEKPGVAGAGISGAYLFAAPKTVEGDALAWGDWVVTG